MAAAVEPGAGTAVGEQLQQDGVGHTAIDDDRLVDSLINGIGHAADLGDHAACDDPGGLVALDLGHFHLGDEGALVVLVPQQARNIGHGHQLFGLEGNGDLSRCGIGVDVVGLAQVIHADGCDHRDEAAVQHAGDQDGSYLSASGQSYSAIKKQVQNLQGYTLREYQSYIWEKGVAKNNFRCIDDLNELNRTLRWDEMSDSQKSAIYMTILDNYNNKMVSSVLIPTYDNDGAFYMSRTKIGIDDLALQANELLSSAVEAQKSIATNNSKVTALEQLTESHEVQMAQAMVDNITRQLADIVSATRELDADCYAQRIRSYLMFSEPQMSFLQRYNVKRSVMLAALVCAVCYLGAAVQACVRRQRQRMENE